MNSNKVVLDASALLAVIQGETGADKLTPDLLGGAVVSSISLAEVHNKLVAKGWDVEHAWQDSLGVIGEVLPFTSDQARAVGTLIPSTRPFGLSLADRACIALALELKCPLYTADRSWKHLKVGVRILCIR